MTDTPDDPRFEPSKTAAESDKTSTEPGETSTDESLFVEVPHPGSDTADALQDLVERVKADGRVAYDKAVIEALCKRQDEDPAGYTGLHWQLITQAGVVPDLLRRAMQKVRAAAKAAQKKAEAAANPKLSDVQLLIALGTTDTLLFHNPEGDPFVDYKVGDHIATSPVTNHGAKGFSGWLRKAYFQATRGAPPQEILNAALNTLAATALHEGPEIRVFPRIGWQDDAIYVDRGTPDSTVIQVDRDGHRIIPLSEAPVRFVRSASTQALPEPIPGGSIEELYELFPTFGDRDAFVLTVGATLSYFNPEGAYPLLAFFGPYNSAKTTLLQATRRLIDPCTATARTLPRDERDMMVAAQKTWAQSFDNVSHITAEMSDALCRLSTGGAFMTRQLNTDTGEIVISARRPVLMTGIIDVVERPDLVSRAIYVWTRKLEGKPQLTEKVFWDRFNNAWPRLLAVLLDAVACALRHQGEDEGDLLRDLPRMADAAVWVTAGETAFGWKRGTFLAAYKRNIEEGIRIAIAGEPLGDAITVFMSSPQTDATGQVVSPRRDAWKGSATDLLAALRVARRRCPAAALAEIGAPADPAVAADRSGARGDWNRRGDQPVAQPEICCVELGASAAGAGWPRAGVSVANAGGARGGGAWDGGR
jgi:hypothetical protein